MTGSELVRKLRRLARTSGSDLSVRRERGKGSHVTVYFRERRAVIPDLSRELKTGTLRAILRQLGVSRDDLRG